MFESQLTKLNRDKLIKALKGKYSAIETGKIFGITRTRVHQIWREPMKITDDEIKRLNLAIALAARVEERKPLPMDVLLSAKQDGITAERHGNPVKYKRAS